ncbi:MAG: hypothetical protein KME32_27040 [Mojavia pulchra JT2-VF2]|jgi:hypothetical protein|uniref:Uncharacterized protein n=1 Tax=Mojavia pulchra JT2-VF2 TaxID=287848 RepID=A0A951Q3I7_9NOST|nr:hypothetical protein [Mojavia pulchra JT2-VF2]
MPIEIASFQCDRRFRSDCLESKVIAEIVIAVSKAILATPETAIAIALASVR